MAALFEQCNIYPDNPWPGPNPCGGLPDKLLHMVEDPETVCLDCQPACPGVAAPGAAPPSGVFAGVGDSHMAASLYRPGGPSITCPDSAICAPRPGGGGDGGGAGAGSCGTCCPPPGGQ